MSTAVCFQLGGRTLPACVSLLHKRPSVLTPPPTASPSVAEANGDTHNHPTPLLRAPFRADSFTTRLETAQRRAAVFAAASSSVTRAPAWLRQTLRQPVEKGRTRWRSNFTHVENLVALFSARCLHLLSDLCQQDGFRTPCDLGTTFGLASADASYI